MQFETLLFSPFLCVEVVKAFEERLCESQEADWALSTSSCTSGLMACLIALGVHEGDEVIVPALSWGQTWSPVLALGATPNAVDLAPEWPVMDFRKVEQSITPRTKLVISAGLWGFPSGLLEVDHTCKMYGITHLVDGAQLFNAKVESKGISHAADLVVLSFNPTKILTVGEGGAILGRGKQRIKRQVTARDGASGQDSR